MRTIKINHKFFYWVVVLFIFSLPLSQFWSMRILGIAFILSFFVPKSSNNESGTIFKNSWDVFLYISVLTLGLTYSYDIKAGLRVIETNLSFLAIPIIFYKLNGIEKKMLDGFFKAFLAGIVTASIVCIMNAAILYENSDDIRLFFFYDLTDIIGFQPTYFAYYLIFAITYSLYLLHYEKDQRQGINVFIVIFLFLVLMLTGGQTAFVSILLVFSFFLLKFVTETKNRQKKIVASLVFLMLITMFLTAFIDKGKRDLSLNDAWDRLILWESAIKAVPNLLTGVGTGDYTLTLNQYYRTHDLQKFAEGNFNSHNQFIQVLFTNGFMGVVTLILLIGRPLYTSSKNHQYMGVLLLFPFLIYGITEVFLGRYQGVVFFILVHQLCILQSNKFSNAIKTI